MILLSDDLIESCVPGGSAALALQMEGILDWLLCLLWLRKAGQRHV